MRRRAAIAIRPLIALCALAVATPAAAQEKTPPYWASITAGDALLRTGPSKDYPAIWRYRRADLPVKVIARHEHWRRVQEMDGTQGWMAVALLADRRTGIVTGGTRVLRSGPSEGSRILWRVAEGVTGRLSECGNGWCRFAVGKRAGFIPTAHIWGVDPGEVID